MKRLSLYLTSHRCSVTIENGASRETSAPTLAQMITHMPEADADVLHRFCIAVLDHMDQKTARAADAVNALITE